MLIFSCNVTATTEIYPYRHTPSLHDALPISPATKRHSWANSLLPAATCSGPGAVSGSGAAGAGAVSFRASLPSGFDPHAPHDERSEEHTSELQSLMRISSAGFCLQKNILTQ